MKIKTIFILSLLMIHCRTQSVVPVVIVAGVIGVVFLAVDGISSNRACVQNALDNYESKMNALDISGNLSWQETCPYFGCWSLNKLQKDAHYNHNKALIDMHDHCSVNFMTMETRKAVCSKHSENIAKIAVAKKKCNC